MVSICQLSQALLRSEVDGLGTVLGRSWEIICTSNPVGLRIQESLNNGITATLVKLAAHILAISRRCRQSAKTATGTKTTSAEAAPEAESAHTRREGREPQCSPAGARAMGRAPGGRADDANIHGHWRGGDVMKRTHGNGHEEADGRGRRNRLGRPRVHGLGRHMKAAGKALRTERAAACHAGTGARTCGQVAR